MMMLAVRGLHILVVTQNVFLLWVYKIIRHISNRPTAAASISGDRSVVIGDVVYNYAFLSV